MVVLAALDPHTLTLRRRGHMCGLMYVIGLGTLLGIVRLLGAVEYVGLTCG